MKLIDQPHNDRVKEVCQSVERIESVDRRDRRPLAERGNSRRQEQDRAAVERRFDPVGSDFV